jgi:hypothetical protein
MTRHRGSFSSDDGTASFKSFENDSPDSAVVDDSGSESGAGMDWTPELVLSTFHFKLAPKSVSVSALICANAAAFVIDYLGTPAHAMQHFKDARLLPVSAPQ